MLQLLALYAPGTESVRPLLHRWRGVGLGEGVAIGTSALLETSAPHLIRIGNHVSIGIRTVVIAHWRESTSDRIAQGVRQTVVIEDDVFVGPGVIVLPNVTIGRGAVVQAGSVVTTSVPPMTMVRGNPAVPVATLRVPLTQSGDLRAFYAGLRPIRAARPDGADRVVAPHA